LAHFDFICDQPNHFHEKWMQLTFIPDLTANRTIAESLGRPYQRLLDNPSGGQTYGFDEGKLISIGNNPPCVIYGKIHSLWVSLGGVNSGFGRPLADIQDLPDGGRCSVLEGGHIHGYGDAVKPCVHFASLFLSYAGTVYESYMCSYAVSFSPDQCTAAHKPVAAMGATFNKMVRFLFGMF
jgi:hypothetical protein